MGNKASSLAFDQVAATGDAADAVNEFGAACVRSMMACSFQTPSSIGSSDEPPAFLPLLAGASGSVFNLGAVDPVVGAYGFASGPAFAAAGSASSATPRWPYGLSCPPAPSDALHRAWLYKLGEVNVAWKRRYAVIRGGPHPGQHQLAVAVAKALQAGTGAAATGPLDASIVTGTAISTVTSPPTYCVEYFDKEAPASSDALRGFGIGSDGVGALGAANGSGGGSGGAQATAVKPKGSIALAGYRVRNSRAEDLELAGLKTGGDNSTGGTGAAGGRGGQASGRGAAGGPSRPGQGLQSTRQLPHTASASSMHASGRQDSDLSAAGIGLTLEPIDRFPGSPKRLWVLRFDDPALAAAVANGRDGGDYGSSPAQSAAALASALARREAVREALRFACHRAVPGCIASREDGDLSALCLPLASLGLAGSGYTGLSLTDHASLQAAALAQGKASFLRGYSTALWSLGLQGYHALDGASEKQQVVSLVATAMQRGSLAELYGQLAQAMAEGSGGRGGGYGALALAGLNDVDSDPAAVRAKATELSAHVHRTAAAAVDGAWPSLSARLELLCEHVPSIVSRYGPEITTMIAGQRQALKMYAGPAADAVAAKALRPVLPILRQVIAPAVVSAADALVASVSSRLSLCLHKGLKPTELRALYHECQMVSSSGGGGAAANGTDISSAGAGAPSSSNSSGADEPALASTLAHVRALTRAPLDTTYTLTGWAAASGANADADADTDEHTGTDDESLVDAVSLAELLASGCLGPVTLWEIETVVEGALRALACAAVYSFVQRLESASKAQRTVEPQAVLAEMLRQLASDRNTAVRVLLGRIGLACCSQRLYASGATDKVLGPWLRGKPVPASAQAGDDDGEGTSADGSPAEGLVSFRLYASSATDAGSGARDGEDDENGEGPAAALARGIRKAARLRRRAAMPADPLASVTVTSPDSSGLSLPPLAKLAVNKASKSAIAAALAPLLHGLPVSGSPAVSTPGSTTVTPGTSVGLATPASTVTAGPAADDAPSPAALTPAASAALRALFFDTKVETLRLLEGAAAARLAAAAKVR